MLKRISRFSIPMFVALPPVGFLLSLFDIKSKSSALVYVLFAMIFGYAISFTDPFADSYRYAQAFSRFDNSLDYNKIVQMYRNGELRDMYRLILFYVVSMFSDNPKVLYALAGLVYGIFSYLSIRVFVRESESRWDIYVVLLALIFYTFVSLSSINGFRFNTGAVVLFYSTYQLVIRQKLSWGIGVALTPLFHYGFILMAPLIILYHITARFFYNRTNINGVLFWLFIAAFTASWVLGTNVINLSFLSQADVLSGAVGSRMEYLNSTEVGSMVDERRQNSLFLNIQSYFGYAIKIFVFMAILYLKKLLGRMKGDRTAYIRLFNFLLFFYAVALFASSIPSGGRFLSIGHLFLMVLIGKFYAIYDRRSIKVLILWGAVAFMFVVAFINFMLPFLILSPTFWYGNLAWIIVEGFDLYIP